ncbi:FAD-binding domain-containing protein [Artomyces pyxidatus]|uniref:FAD-binding domain-containing protein n=1 Tax=Artomyces pyxidatus TaxID=48021 RepID=A0ACB8SQV3_9AGAM|nr:FAD-binding domain-containing protein [Artomyces pyxidatus]
MGLVPILAAFQFLVFFVLSSAVTDNQDAAVLETCRALASVMSNASLVSSPSSEFYSSDIGHWSVSSTANSTCSVEPGTVADVGRLLQTLASSRIPFAVKGGGHTTNPGFSSTSGVQVSMARFSEITVDKASQTVDVGAGVTWDEVYIALEPVGVNVVGGRIPGVGVAGVTLGGGYSWKSNRFGLALDNIQAYELVLPNGTVTTVTQANEDLWFALRGSLNNFGIVTKFTLKTHPQTEVWAGVVTMSFEHLGVFNRVLANFAEHVDEKAAVVAGYESAPNATTVSAFIFYDAPSPPAGLFDDMLAIPAISNTVQTTTYATFVSSLITIVGLGGSRVYFGCAPVLKYTETLLSSIMNETARVEQRIKVFDPTALAFTIVEPFQPGLFSHGAPSAYPPDRSHTILPTNPYLVWSDPSMDSVMHDALGELTRSIQAAAIAEGQDIAGAAAYTNYALFDTPVDQIYGANLPRLMLLKRKYDPSDVMGLTGGFKL